MDNSLLQLIGKHHKNTPELMQDDIKLYFDELTDLKRRKFRNILEQQYKLETLGEFYKETKK